MSDSPVSQMVLALSFRLQKLPLKPFSIFFLVLNDSIEYQIKEEDSMFLESCEEQRHNTINRTPQSMVEFLDLKDVYEKVQSRAGGGSHQRVSSGFINIRAISEGQLCGMNVFVERVPEAAALSGDTNGRIPLEVNHEDYFQNQVCKCTTIEHVILND
jgi:hypothetical protein